MCKNNIKKKILPKILPAVGGLSKQYLRKSHIFEKILVFLARQIEEIQNSKNRNDAQIILDKIYNHLKIISKYEKFKKNEFYFKFFNIINNY